MLFEIKNWRNGAVIFAIDLTDEQWPDRWRIGVEKAVMAEISLNDAELNDAELNYAKLNDAELNGVKLNGAELDGAELNRAELNGAELNGAELNHVRDDLWAVLSAAFTEALGVRDALVRGHVNGSVYEGECACLIGTIANLQGRRYTDMPNLRPNASRPIELFFFNIKKGDTPDNSSVVKIAVEWIDIWLHNSSASFNRGIA